MTPAAGHRTVGVGVTAAVITSRTRATARVPGGLVTSLGTGATARSSSERNESVESHTCRRADIWQGKHMKLLSETRERTISTKQRFSWLFVSHIFDVLYQPIF